MSKIKNKLKLIKLEEILGPKSNGLYLLSSVYKGGIKIAKGISGIDCSLLSLIIPYLIQKGINNKRYYLPLLNLEVRDRSEIEVNDLLDEARAKCKTDVEFAKSKNIILVITNYTEPSEIEVITANAHISQKDEPSFEINELIKSGVRYVLFHHNLYDNVQAYLQTLLQMKYDNECKLKQTLGSSVIKYINSLKSGDVNSIYKGKSDLLDALPATKEYQAIANDLKKDDDIATLKSSKLVYDEIYSQLQKFSLPPIGKCSGCTKEMLNNIFSFKINDKVLCEVCAYSRLITNLTTNSYNQSKEEKIKDFHLALLLETFKKENRVPNVNESPSKNKISCVIFNSIDAITNKGYTPSNQDKSTTTKIY